MGYPKPNAPAKPPANHGISPREITIVLSSDGQNCPRPNRNPSGITVLRPWPPRNKQRLTPKFQTRTPLQQCSSLATEKLRFGAMPKPNSSAAARQPSVSPRKVYCRTSLIGHQRQFRLPHYPCLATGMYVGRENHCRSVLHVRPIYPTVNFSSPPLWPVHPS